MVAIAVLAIHYLTAVGTDVKKVAFDARGMGDGGNGLAVAAHLVAVFGAWGAAFKVDDPGFGGGVDDTVGAQHFALKHKAAFVHAAVVGIEEPSDVALVHHVVESVAQQGCLIFGHGVAQEVVLQHGVGLVAVMDEG